MLGKLNIVKMTTFPKSLCRFTKILILQKLILVLKHMLEKEARLPKEKYWNYNSGFKLSGFKNVYRKKTIPIKRYGIR